MPVVNLKIGGKDYQVACDAGEEEHLRLLGDEIDERVRSLLFKMGGNPGEALALLMASLTMADELLDVRRECDRLSSKVEKDRHEAKMQEMETAMATTLDEIAMRIEKIAEQVELG